MRPQDDRISLAMHDDMSASGCRTTPESVSDNARGTPLHTLLPPPDARQYPVSAGAVELSEIRTELPAYEVSVIAGPLRTAYSTPTFENRFPSQVFVQSTDLESSTSSSVSPNMSGSDTVIPTAPRRRVSFLASISPSASETFQSDSIGVFPTQTPGSGTSQTARRTSSSGSLQSQAGRNSPGWFEPGSESVLTAPTVKRNSILPLPQGPPQQGSSSATLVRRAPTRHVSN